MNIVTDLMAGLCNYNGRLCAEIGEI